MKIAQVGDGKPIELSGEALEHNLNPLDNRPLRLDQGRFHREARQTHTSKRGREAQELASGEGRASQYPSLPSRNDKDRTREVGNLALQAVAGPGAAGSAPTPNSRRVYTTLLC
jgi:hypothetical protein